MNLSLEIVRESGMETQTSCFVNGKKISEFYSFGEFKEDGSQYSDAEIASIVEADLILKGYS